MRGLGKVIDVQFRPHDRGRWCVRCDEPFPEGTALCPRCGGELSSAAQHRDDVRNRARKAARRAVATGAAGVVMLLSALLAWLLAG
jgi:predicted amidophosphoribosyltransferase